MRKALLASTLLCLSVGGVNAQAIDITSATITPGHGSITDNQGTVWTIIENGSIKETRSDGTIVWTPGGGGTAVLAFSNGKMYGLDNGGNGGGWYALTDTGDSWQTSKPPADLFPTDPPPPHTPVPASPSNPVAPTVPALPPNATPTDPNQPPNAPLTPVTCSTEAGAGAGYFHVENGQIIGMDGSIFIARGVNMGLYYHNAPLAQLQALFPGTNFIRLAVNDYPSPSALSAFVTQFTDAGIVVEIDQHKDLSGFSNGGSQGSVFTGGDLAQEQQWFSAIADAFKGNPYIWFGTKNEPPENPSGAALSAWQRQTVQTIRATGNKNPVMIEMNCGGSAQCGTNYDASAYVDLENIIWDIHYYNWLSGMSTFQSAISALITGMVNAAQEIKSADGIVPVIIGEYGDSTTGQGTDPGAEQAVAAVVNSGAKREAGSAAWMFQNDGQGDNLLDASGQPSNPYGMQVKLYTNSDIVPMSACQERNQAIQTIAAVTTSIQQNPPDGKTQIPAALPPSVAAANQSAQADINAADTQIQQSEATSSDQTAQAQAVAAQVKAQIDALLSQIQAGKAPPASALTPGQPAP